MTASDRYWKNETEEAKRRAIETIRYCPKTGRLFWIKRVSAQAKEGAECGHVSQGYRRIRILGKSHFAHRVAWMLHTGRWPSGEIDHANGCGLDNRIGNLRVCSREENQRNTRCPRRSKSGIKGVSWCKAKRRWRVSIASGERRIQRYFKSLEGAEEFAILARESLHSDFARHDTLSSAPSPGDDQ